MENTLFYYGVGTGIHYDQIAQDIVNQRPSEIILFGETEWEISNIEKIIKISKDHKVRLKIVHGSFENDYQKNLYENLGLDLDDVTFWGTYWLNFTEWCMSNRYRNYESKVYQDVFQYPFLNMNCRAHVHRCALIDELAKRNLIDKGKVSWHDHLEENQDFVFKYFDRKNKLKLGDEFETKLDSLLIPDCYHDTFMVLVTEATTKAPFLTEKTAMPLFFKKPFLTIAGANYNQQLFDLGFLPYDEIFDYSFDKELDLFKRISMAVDNVENIISADHTMLYNKIRHKLEHNFQLALQITKDSTYIPKVIKDKIQSNLVGHTEEQGTDPRFKMHLERCGYFNP